jgi:hypothetical protein
MKRLITGLVCLLSAPVFGAVSGAGNRPSSCFRRLWKRRGSLALKKLVKVRLGMKEERGL